MPQVSPDLRNRLLAARLPVVPQILLKLIEKCQDDDAGMNVLADLIAKDPGMASRVLAIANSSVFHRRGRPAGLEMALATLGTDMLKTLVINESVSQVFNHLTHANACDLRAFWKHSLSVAVLARDIATHLGTPNPEEAYLAGLLHDVGRLALLATADKEFAFLFFARDDDKLCEVETNLLNLTHTEAGAILADRWKLDSFLSDSLLYHHSPGASVGNAHPLVRSVILAHLISGRPDDDPDVALAAAGCQLPVADIPALRERSEARVREFADLLGIDLDLSDDLAVPTDGWEIAGRLAGLADGTAPAAARDDADETPGTPHETVRRALAEGVRDAVLTTGLRQSLAGHRHDETAALAAIFRAAHLLFGFDDAVFFRTSPPGDTLLATPAGECGQRLAGFAISTDGAGRLSQAAGTRQVAFAERQPTASDLAETQLMRLFGCDALALLPVVHGVDYLGMLVCAARTEHLPALNGRERFLRTFGVQAGAALRASGTAVAETPAAESGLPRKIVHESNNALSIIKNYLGVLDGKLGEQRLARKEITILNDEVDRVSRIINGSGATATAAPVDANQTIRRVVQLFGDTVPSPAATRVVAEVPETPCPILCPAESLTQILINLVKNAFEAMPEGGEIRVANDGFANRDGRLYVALGVNDNGPGIPPEVLRALFTPVRTRKGGTHQGLGLNIVDELVKQAHGLISCRSSGAGTRFEILFPAAPPGPGESS